MDAISWFELFIFIFFLFLSGFFSSAETAFTGINKIRLRTLLESESTKKKKIESVLTHPRRLITGILIGNNIANIAASVLATKVFLSILQVLGVSNVAVGLTVVTVVMTILILIFGEITPKSVALKNPEKTALLYTKPIYYFISAIQPIIYFFSAFASWVSKILGISESDHFLTAEEIKTALDIGEEEGLLEKDEHKMIHSIFEFSETIVREIMTPRTDAVCVQADSVVSDVISLVQDKGHSRIPVYEDRIDNICGVVYAKDLLGVEDRQAPIRPLMRPAVFIPETKTIEALFKQMKKTKFHLAIVVDEYGGMSGLVTFEDIIEEIIGEVEDEYDTEEFPEFTQLNPQHFLVDAGHNLEDLGEKIEVVFPESDDYDTIGGFVLSLIGKLPVKEEQISFQNLLIIIREVRERRIKKMEIIKSPEISEPGADSA